MNSVVIALAEILSARTGETVDEAILVAIKERIERLGVAPNRASYEESYAIAASCAALPEYDVRSADEILGYNEHGTFE